MKSNVDVGTAKRAASFRHDTPSRTSSQVWKYTKRLERKKKNISESMPVFFLLTAKKNASVVPGRGCKPQNKAEKKAIRGLKRGIDGAKSGGQTKT